MTNTPEQYESAGLVTLANALRRSDHENDRLRAVIENAPHDPDCEQWNLQPQTGRPLTDVCTCWKAGAL